METFPRARLVALPKPSAACRNVSTDVAKPASCAWSLKPLDLHREDDLTQREPPEVGADVPQTVAVYWLDLLRDHYFRTET
jgi:hypothetical protein